MHFGLSETQETIRKSAREFFTAECPIAEVRRLAETDTAIDDKLWKKFAEQGWTGIIFPEEYDGFGLGLVEMAVALEEMGRALIPGPFISTVLVAGTILDRAGTEEQKKKYLAPICRGEAKATLALLEKSASWDLNAVQLEAKSGTITGEKLFVADAKGADFLLVAAKQEGALTLLIVPTNAKGVTITLMPGIDLTRRLYSVSFDNVEVPSENVIANATEAIEAAHDVATVGLVAEMAGGMQRLLDITVEYAKTRKQFGKPIGTFQAVQHQCADMLFLLEGVRSSAYYAAWALGENQADAKSAVSVAKVYASEGYRDAGNKAIQVHGGMGFTWENDTHLYYRRAKGSEIAFGDATFHRERIAKILVDKA
jgi:alkylation response protein AidB-like acyl-CoA dehydrogenase